MAKLSKKAKALQGKVDSTKLYPIDAALSLVKECATAKFDESIDVSVQLGIDAKKSDQVVRGAVVMPNGTGKTKRVAVFAQGAKAEEAKAAGAANVAVSTRTPTPMVEETATLRRYTPLLLAGLALFSASIRARRLPVSLSDSKERRPIVAWMIPALSTRNCTWPALALRTAVATSGVTVPTLGLGMRPRGPST